MFDFIKEHPHRKNDIRSDINRIEKKYDIMFPDILRNYYENYDGAKINTVIFDINGYECEVAKMVSLVDESLPFEMIVDNDKEDGFLADTFYPIARDRGGNYYYWDSVTYEVYLVLNDDCDNPFRVAKSVEQFFEVLDLNS